MRNRPDRNLAEALDAHIARVHGHEGHPVPQPPPPLDRVARVLVTGDPEPAFLARLADDLAARSIQLGARTIAPRPRRAAVRYAIAAAGAFALVAAVSAPVLLLRPDGGARPVNAAAIVEQAREATAAASRVSPQSFRMTVRHELWAEIDGREFITHATELRRWVVQPDRWRSEIHFFSYDRSGLTGERLHQLFVSDGTTTWKYLGGSLQSEPYSPSPVNTSFTMGRLAEGVSGASIEETLENAAACYTPSLAGTEELHGRTAYVIDLGDDRCLPDPGPNRAGFSASFSATTRVWIDAETFLAVKWTARTPQIPNMWMVSEVTDLEIDAAIDPSTFEYRDPGP